jgi:hypothetical protein
MSKLIIKNKLKGGASLLYEIPKTERFVSFADFNTFDDLGFTPGRLRIELCSNIVFLTQDRKDDSLFVNILLIDPYYDVPQLALFKSSQRFSFPPGKKYQDIMIKNFLYCNKAATGETEFKCLTQYPEFFEITKLEEQKEEGAEASAGSGQAGEEDEESSSDYGSEAEQTSLKLAPVEFVMDQNNIIYYVSMIDGHCAFKEILPGSDDDGEHTTIYEVKSEQIFAYSAAPDGRTFHFMDQYRVICKLERMKDSRALLETAEFYIKDKDRPQFQPGGYYDRIILSDLYMIWHSKIFYIFARQLDNGILDMEELAELPDDPKAQELEARDTKQFVQGPYRGVDGSFTLVYKYGHQKQFYYSSRSYLLPDCQHQLLARDFGGKVDLTTFLHTGDILLKIGYRFMVFDQHGAFIDEAEFSDVRMEEQKQLQAKKRARWGLLSSLLAKGRPAIKKELEEGAGAAEPRAERAAKAPSASPGVANWERMQLR